MAGLWDAFEARFKPNYGLSLVAQLAEDAGGAKNIKKYFVSSRDNALAYQRALTQWEMRIAGSEMPRELKRDRQGKALLIPRSVAEKAGFFPTSEEQEEPIAVPTPEPTVTAVASSQEPIPESIANPPQPPTAEIPTGNWETEPSPQLTPKRIWIPTHRTSDDIEVAIDRRFGRDPKSPDRAICRNSSGKITHPNILLNDLTPIGDVVCAA